MRYSFINIVPAQRWWQHGGGWRFTGLFVSSRCFFFNDFGYLIEFICPIRTRDDWDPQIPLNAPSILHHLGSAYVSLHTHAHTQIQKYNRVLWGLQQPCCQNSQFPVFAPALLIMSRKKCERDQHQKLRDKSLQTAAAASRTRTELLLVSSLLQALRLTWQKIRNTSANVNQRASCSREFALRAPWRDAQPCGGAASSERREREREGPEVRGADCQCKSITIKNARTVHPLCNEYK